MTEHEMELVSDAASPLLGSAMGRGLGADLTTHTTMTAPDDFGTLTRRDASPPLEVLPAGSWVLNEPNVSGDDGFCAGFGLQPVCCITLVIYTADNTYLRNSQVDGAQLDQDS